MDEKNTTDPTIEAEDPVATEPTESEENVDSAAPDEATDAPVSTDAVDEPGIDTGDESAIDAVDGDSLGKLEVLKDLGVNTVYLMGTSFILGVLFTVFVLLVLDFIRRNAEEEKK